MKLDIRISDEKGCFQLLSPSLYIGLAAFADITQQLIDYIDFITTLLNLMFAAGTKSR